ncbi:endonuclease/exonuclease/phosphatase family protein [Pimelobacter simplex]|uniref:endonuclease/exonuclease/phosphatase family protein n=1 Tax=Nocardioides simplex TaxID=2045 RepID=UPI0037FD6AB9
MSYLRSVARTPRMAIAAVVAALAVSLLWLPGGDSGVRLAADTPGTPGTEPVSAPLRIVQANIKSNMSTAKTKADIAAAYAQRPDFVTFNEVTYRPDSWLAPAGYQLWRTPGAFTGETPVAWNTARWNMVAQGTWMISNKLRKQPSKEFELGKRYANWVSLQSNIGERISVVSTHFAPRSGYTKDQIEPSFKRLALLVDQLRAHGPVLVGGDLNVNYRAATEYPRTTVTALGLTPVYDVTGTALPTGMYRNSTIDYILLASAGQYTVRGQSVRVVHSDHRQLTADLALTGSSASAFSPGTVLTDPRTSPRAVTALMVRSINLAPKGAVVHLATRDLKMAAVVKAIQQARKRGVHVQLLTSGKKVSPGERTLIKLLGTNVRKKSWVAHQRNWTRFHLPAASSLVSASGGTRALRIDSNRPLVKDAHKVATRAVVTIDKTSYDSLFVPFFKAAGRPL